MDSFFVRFATATARIAGKPWTFGACLGIVVLWALSGPLFGFNDTWQLVINTSTTIVTFLMVFLIQNTQNRDGAAMQAKLDELLHAVSKADERFIGIEHLTDKELDRILAQVEARAEKLHGGHKMPVVATREEDRKEGAARGGRATQAKARRTGARSQGARTGRKAKA